MGTYEQSLPVRTTWFTAPIHGELHSTDAHGGVALKLYPVASATERVQGATEYLTITDVLLVFTAGGLYEIVFYPIGGSVADGAGLVIARGTASVNGGIAHHFVTPITGPVGYGIGVIAAAGLVDVIVTGGLT